MEDNSVVLVLSLPSSGSSCIAGILHHLGVDMGKDFTNDGAGYCFYEDQEFVNLAHDIHSDMGLTPPNYAFDGSSINRVINFSQSQKGLWGLKHVSLCWLAPWIIINVDDYKVINVMRPLITCAKSWANRISIQVSESMSEMVKWDLAKQFTLSMLDKSKILNVYYDDVVANPFIEVERISQFVFGKPCRNLAIEHVKSYLKHYED